MAEQKKDKENYNFKRFGRYLLLDHLVDGGMAKIYRARFLGEKADKIVAIKMVQPQYSKDKNFQEMFDTELKLAFALHHPNICQTYDYGQYKGIWYTAMEYVDGKNLKQFLDRLKKRHEAFPLHLATYVISQVCHSLYYAHTFTDKLSGDHYNIIHRDISPHNIMLTYDGAVKVIDFGIAKTEMKQESTQAGTIKGKLSYLAPEYIEGKELDQRYDMFAVGITFWEMLCGRKLFVGANDLSVINQIRDCKVPVPSSINPTVPKELDHIILKALNKDRDLRYKDMNALSKVLLKFLYTHYPDFNPIDLADFSRDIFAEEIKKDRDQLREFGKMDIKPFIQEMLSDFHQESAAAATKVTVDSATIDQLLGQRPLPIDLQQVPAQANLQMENELPPPLNRPNELARPAKVDYIKQKEHQQAQQRKNPLSKGISDQTLSRIRHSSESNAQGRRRWTQAAVAAVAIIILGLGKDFILQSPILSSLLQQHVGESQERGLSSVSKGLHEDQAQGSGLLYFENYEPSMQIYINDQLVQYSPLGLTVPYGKVSISVKTADSGSFVTTIDVTAKKSVKKILIPKAKERLTGYLTINKKFPQGSKVVYIDEDGQKKELLLPVRNEKVPAGKLKIMIIDRQGKALKQMVTVIEKDKFHLF